MPKIKIDKRIKILVLLLMFLIPSIIFAYKYVKNEAPVYIYDYSGYYEMWKEFGNTLLKNPTVFINKAIYYIRNYDYNCIPILLGMPMFLWFGSHRVVYISMLTILYIVPFLLYLTYFIEKNILDNKNKNYKILVIIILCTFTYTKWWAPTLRGLPDIITLLPLLVAFDLWYKNPYYKPLIPISIGLLVYFTFLSRRYFAFEVLGFYVSIFLYELYIYIKSDNKKEILKNEIINFSLSALFFLIPLLILQYPLVKNIISSNYSNSYSAFQLSVIGHIKKIVSEFSIYGLVMAFIGVIVSIKNKKYRKLGITITINIIVTYLLFARVQAMGVHHFLMISIWIFILNIIAIVYIYELIKCKKIKTIFLIVVGLIAITNFVTTFITRNIYIPIISQKQQYQKLKYDNLESLNKMIFDLREIIINKDVKFTVFASSDNFSDNLIETLGDKEIDNKIVYNSAIDLRDGLNYNSLLAEYALVTDKAEVGVSKQGQRIVSVPNDMIYKNYGIGKAYQRISGPYKIQGERKAYIYKKTRSFTREEIDMYINKLESYHKEWENKFTELDKMILSLGRHLGEVGGSLFIKNNKKIYITPGEKTTYLAFPLNKKIKRITLSFIIEGDIPNKISKNVDSKIELSIDNKETKDILVKTNKQAEVKLNTENKEWLFISVDKGKELSYDFVTLNIKEIEYCN